MLIAYYTKHFICTSQWSKPMFLQENLKIGVAKLVKITKLWRFRHSSVSLLTPTWYCHWEVSKIQATKSRNFTFTRKIGTAYIMLQNRCKRRTDSIYTFKFERNSLLWKSQVAFWLHFQGGVEFWWARREEQIQGKGASFIEEYN